MVQIKVTTHYTTRNLSKATQKVQEGTNKSSQGPETSQQLKQTPSQDLRETSQPPFFASFQCFLWFDSTNQQLVFLFSFIYYFQSYSIQMIIVRVVFMYIFSCKIKYFTIILSRLWLICIVSLVWVAYYACRPSQIPRIHIFHRYVFLF